MSLGWFGVLIPRPFRSQTFRVGGFVFKVRRSLSRPARLEIAAKEQEEMAWKYKFGPFAAQSAPDVVSRELTLTVNGASQVATYPVATMESDEFTVDEGAHITATYLEIDDAGNKSPAAPLLEDDAIDDQAPPGPTARLGILSKVEV